MEPRHAQDPACSRHARDARSSGDCEVEHGQIGFHPGTRICSCSGLFAREPPQSGAAEKVPAPASAPAPAATPAPSGAQPTATTPQTATPGQAQPESAPPQAPAPAAAQSPTRGAAPAPEPSAPAAPTFREVTIPAETPISVTLVTPIASNTSKVEDQVRGKLAKAIIVGGTTVVPAGSEVIGAVIEADESGRVKGRASVAVRFDRLTVRGESHRIQTAKSRARQRQARKVTSRRVPSVPARAPSSAASQAGEEGLRLARASAGPLPCWRRRARKFSWPPAPRSARGCWTR